MTFEKFNNIVNSVINNTIKEKSMQTITANDLKLKGVKAFTTEETLITIRGKEQYVVLDINTSERMREAELDAAYKEVLRDYEQGNFTSDIDKHINNIDA